MCPQYILTEFISDTTKRLTVLINGVEKASTGTIIIPTSNEIDVSEGDYVTEGIINDLFNLRTLISNRQMFKVISIDDNRKGTLQHYKIGVSE